MSHKDLVDRWFEEVWNQNNADAMDDLLAEDCEMIGLDANPSRSRDEMKDFHARMNATLGDINISVDEFMECGDQIATIFCVSAVHRATGKPVAHHCACIGWIEQGVIKRTKNVNDFLAAFMQAGVLPENTVQLGLTTVSFKSDEWVV